MVLTLLLLCLGIALLYFGADWLVKGASRLALILGVKPLTVGLTIVAFGTSMPELSASLVAQWVHGSGSIAIANVIGSNIFNIAWILGLAALLYRMVVHQDVIRRDMPINILLTAALLFFMWDEQIVRIEGFIFLVLFSCYLVVHFYDIRRHRRMENDERALRAEIGTTKKKSPVLSLTLIVLGFVGLILGAKWTVDAAVELARALNLTERVIGLTLVAMGTSLPELATSLVAAIKKEADIAVGNIIGSNIFNIGFIVGVVGSLAPLSFDLSLKQYDIWFLLGLTVALFLLLVWRKALGRLEACLLLAAAVVYTATVFFI